MSGFDVNNPTTWGTGAIHNPPNFDVAKFQKKLDKMFGLSETGLPLVRLVWAGDIKNTYSKFYSAWTAMGFGTETELRAKYRYATLKIPGTGDFIDIPPPRWVIEQWEHPGQYAGSWDATRWSKEGKELRPPPPMEGYYSELFTIADHTETCCKESMAWCWGTYRQPAYRDLERLQTAKFLRDRDKKVNTDKPLSEDTLALISKEVDDERIQNEALKDAKLNEFIDDNALELIARFTGQSTTDKTSKFSLPTEKRIIPSTTL